MVPFSRILLYIAHLSSVTINFYVFSYVMYQEGGSEIYPILAGNIAVVLLHIVTISDHHVLTRVGFIHKTVSLMAAVNIFFLQGRHLLFYDQSYSWGLQINPLFAALLVPVNYSLLMIRLSAAAFVFHEPTSDSVANAEALILTEVVFKVVVDYIDLLYFANDWSMIDGYHGNSNFIETVLYLSPIVVLSGFAFLGLSVPSILTKRKTGGGAVISLDVFLFAKHSCLGSAILVDLPLMVIRIMFVVAGNMQFFNWIFKNMVSISVSSLIRSKVTALEGLYIYNREEAGKTQRDESRGMVKMTNENSPREDTYQADTHDSLAVLLEGTRELTDDIHGYKLMSDNGEEYQVGRADISKAVRNQFDKLEIVGDMATKLTSIRQLPIRGFKALLLWRRAAFLPLGFSMGDPSSSMFVDNEQTFFATNFRSLLLITSMLIGFSTPLVVAFLLLYMNVFSGGTFVAALVDFVGDDYVASLCDKSGLCYLIYIFIACMSLLLVVILMPIGNKFEAILHGIFFFVQQIGNFMFLEMILWIRVLDGFLVLRTGSTFNLMQYTTLLIVIPSVLSLCSNFRVLYELLFKRRAIMTRVVNHSATLERESKEMQINITRVLVESDDHFATYVSCHLGLIFSGCRHQFLPPSYNFILMGPNRIKAIRCSDAIHRYHWLGLVFKFMTRACLVIGCWSSRVLLIFILDLIGHLIYNIVSHLHRRNGMLTSEITAIYKDYDSRRRTVLQNLTSMQSSEVDDPDVEEEQIKLNEERELADSLAEKELWEHRLYKEARGTESLKSLTPIGWC